MVEMGLMVNVKVWSKEVLKERTAAVLKVFIRLKKKKKCERGFYSIFIPGFGNT